VSETDAVDPVEPKRTARSWRYWPLAFLLLLVPPIAFGIDRVAHVGRVWRGVDCSGVPLSGLSEQAARSALTEAGKKMAGESLEVTIAGKALTVPMSELGYALDVEATLRAAMAAKREGTMAEQLQSWAKGFASKRSIDRVARVNDEKLTLLFDKWEAELGLLPFEGTVTVKDGAPVADPPRDGRAIDRAAARSALAKLIAQADRRLEVPLEPRKATRTAATVDEAVARARELTRGAVVLYVEKRELEPAEKGKDAKAKPKKPAAKPGRSAKPAAERDEPPERISVTFTKEQLLSALRSRLVDQPPKVEVYLDIDTIDAALAEAKKHVEAPSVDAHFEVDDRDKPHVVAGRAGRIVNTERVIDAVVAAAQTPDRLGKLSFEPGAPPTVGVAELEALGIKALVSKFTTMHPCCMPRVDNIHRIAEMIDGVVVKPGEQFSVNAHVGPRTVAKGFKPAPTIVYGEMEDTIGGGVSQFATTLFNAAFYGGYDIVERTPHSYYFPRYPMGHEATLSFPKPDLVIKNDTKAGLLIRCIAAGTSITVKLYGDNGGRKVRRKVSPVRNVTKPPIEYLADPSLDPEREKVKERGQVGWTVVVSRVIEFADGTSRTDERKVIYQPRVRRLRVHPCRIPEGEKGHTGEPCPEPKEKDDEPRTNGDAPADVGDAHGPIEDEG
jgi:vancomycin resistance protein YoaR